MPLDPAGNMSLVPSYFAQPGTTIRTEQHNPPLEDIASVMSMHLVRDGRNGMVGPLNMGTFPVQNVGAGVNPTDAATISQVVGAGPLGVVTDFAGSTAPNGWMLCYGQAISRTTYAALFAVIGTAYGAGDGATSFNLPDCRGGVTAGKDDMGGSDSGRLSGFIGALARTLGGKFGAASHVLTEGQMPSHIHPLNDLGHSHVQEGPLNRPASDRGNQSSNFSINEIGGRLTSHSFTNISILPAGGNQAHLNVQPTIIFNKIIRVSL